MDARADAIRRMQAIYRKARELAEERGLARELPHHRHGAGDLLTDRDAVAAIAGGPQMNQRA